MSKEYSTIENLVEQVQEMNAGEGHVEIGGIHGNPELTAVISVYEGQNPSHKILDRLYDWAEENNTETKEMIEMLSSEVLD